MGLSPSELIQFRSLAISGILATDMKHHQQITEKTKRAGNERAQSGGDLSSSGIDSEFLVGLFIHCSDLSNPALPHFSVASKWALMCCEEFTNIVKEERKRGMSGFWGRGGGGGVIRARGNIQSLNESRLTQLMQTPPHTHRQHMHEHARAPTTSSPPPQFNSTEVTAFMDHLDTEKNIAQLQMNFVDYVVKPLWAAVGELLPTLALFTENCKENRAKWERVQKGEKLEDVRREDSAYTPISDAEAEEHKRRASAAFDAALVTQKEVTMVSGDDDLGI